MCSICTYFRLHDTDMTCSKYDITNLDKVGKANLNANIASTLQAGCFAGCFVASWFADRWGRKMALQVAGPWLSLFTSQKTLLVVSVAVSPVFTNW